MNHMALASLSQSSPGHSISGVCLTCLPHSHTCNNSCLHATATPQRVYASAPYRGGVMCGRMGQFYCELRSLTYAHSRDLPTAQGPCLPSTRVYAPKGGILFYLTATIGVSDRMPLAVYFMRKTYPSTCGGIMN